LNKDKLNIGKNEPYYIDEMDYGTLNINYKFNELNYKEIIAYKNYESKHKAYYERIPIHKI